MNGTKVKDLRPLKTFHSKYRYYNSLNKLLDRLNNREPEEMVAGLSLRLTVVSTTIRELLQDSLPSGGINIFWTVSPR